MHYRTVKGGVRARVTCVHVQTCMCTCANMRLAVQVYVRECVLVHVRVCIRSRACVCAYVSARVSLDNRYASMSTYILGNGQIRRRFGGANWRRKSNAILCFFAVILIYDIIYM